MTPHINADGMIQMNIDLQNDRPDFTRQVKGVPSIEKKQARTEVMIRDGDTSVIGGIYTRTWRTSAKRSPV